MYQLGKPMIASWCILGLFICLCNVAENKLSPDTFSGLRIPIRTIAGDSGEPRRPITYAASRRSSSRRGGLPGAVRGVHWGDDLNLDTPQFLVTLGLGTPARSHTLMIHTGSSLSWVICQCNGCDDDSDAAEGTSRYLPSQSTTSAKVLCGSSLCLLGGDTRCDTAGSQPTCEFSLNYIDGASSSGLLYQDTLTLSDSLKIDNFTFGCNNRFQQSVFGKIDGVLALGNGAASVATQSYRVPLERFSYCLPPPGSDRGFLSIGWTGPTSSRSRVQYTTMQTRRSTPDYYFVDLMQMYVNGTRMDVPLETFTRQGVVLDSGTHLSYLPQAAFVELSRIVREQMRLYGGVVELQQNECYDVTNVHGGIHMPSIMLQFYDGAYFEFDSRGTYYELPAGKNNRVWCLAFRATSGVAVIGSRLQVSSEVIYDLKNRTIGFGRAGSC